MRRPRSNAKIQRKPDISPAISPARGGHVDAVSRKLVAGWAADPERPDEQLVVTISIDGTEIGQAVANRLRQDLVRLGNYGDGRHGFSFPFPEPLDPLREHHVTVCFAEDGQLLPNGRQVLPIAPAPEPSEILSAKQQQLTPILVTAPGRSGTTLLMGLLARSPEIVAAELVPYELRLLSYYAAVFHVLNEAADLDRSTHPDRLEGDGYFVGFNPFHSQKYDVAFRDQRRVRDFFDEFVRGRTLVYARELLNEYYHRLARDRAKPGARFFAEKGNNLHKPTRLFAREVFGAIRELVIVRDPRDVLCSHMSYFSSSSEKAFEQLSHSSRQLLAIRDEGREDTHFLKYEDMVRNDPACFDALSGFLGTTVMGEDTETRADVFSQHGTSNSPEASVARWRTDLPDDLKSRCARDWGHFLETFGYDID
jgi:hypothetical protein